MTSSAVRYQLIAERDLYTYKETVRVLYLDAFAKAPHFVSEEKSHAFISKYDEWIKKDGFKLLIAFLEHTPVGFCFGWSSVQGDYWYEKFVATKPELETLLQDCFELVDIGVISTAKGRGIGKQLLKEIKLSTKHKNLLLIVASDNTEAKAMYLRMGWVIETEQLEVTKTDYRIVMSYSKPSA